MSETTSAADLITITVFPDESAQTKREEKVSLAEFVERFRNRPPAAKKEGQLIKLAEFGTRPTKKGSLRHDGNVAAITGVEGDYDGGKVSPAEARERLERRHLRAAVITSWQHTPESPRFRVYAPCSRPLNPEDRYRLVSGLNGALGGILNAESWTLSQSYYVDHPADGEYLVLPTFDDPAEGVCIDEWDELDEVAIGKPSGNGKKPGDAEAVAAEILPDDEVRRIRSALAFCGDADDRNDWVHVGIMLHATGAGEQAYGLWTEWSQQSAKYDPADQRRVWDSFSSPAAREERGDKRVTIASLFQLAYETGWTDPTAGNIRIGRSADPDDDYDRAERRAIQAESAENAGTDGDTAGRESVIPPVAWRTLADIDDAPLGELICHLIEPDGPTLIYAPGGTGKGMTAAWLIAECRKLGIRVLIYDAEQHPREWRRRTSGLGVDPADVVYVEPRDLPKELLGLPLHRIVPYLGKIANAAGCGLLIVDSILAAANLSEEGLKSDAAAPYMYAAALGELGIPSVSFGHTAKANSAGDPYGSVSWVNAMRLTWLGTRAEGQGHRVRWTPRKRNERGDIKALLLSFRYDEVGRLTAVSAEDDERMTRELITELLAGGPRTVEDIAEELVDADVDRTGSHTEAVTRTKDVVRRTLGRMRHAGLAHKTGGRGAPWALGDGRKVSRIDRSDLAA